METKKIGKCQNCREQNCELLEVETEKGKKLWCDACFTGRVFELEESKKLEKSEKRIGSENS